MRWEQVRRQFNGLAHRMARRGPIGLPPNGIRADSQAITSPDEVCGEAARTARLRPLGEWNDLRRRGASDGSDEGRVLAHRRRWLQRKSAHMRMAMRGSIGQYSLAMLDRSGRVVSWHDRASSESAAPDDVVDDDLSRFYVPEDVVAGVPRRDLHVAVSHGISIERGWRRRAGGSIYWGTTVIRALVNRSGQLQGFSHLTRQSAGPRVGVRTFELDTTRGPAFAACGSVPATTRPS